MLKLQHEACITADNEQAMIAGGVSIFWPQNFIPQPITYINAKAPTCPALPERHCRYVQLGSREVWIRTEVVSESQASISRPETAFTTVATRGNLKFHYRQRLVQKFFKKKTYLTENEHCKKSRMHLGVSWSCMRIEFVVDTNCDESQTFCKRLRSIWQEDPWGKASKRSRSTWPVSLFFDGQGEQRWLRMSDL